MDTDCFKTEKNKNMIDKMERRRVNRAKKV